MPRLSAWLITILVALLFAACQSLQSDIEAWASNIYEDTCYEPLKCERLKVKIVTEGDLTATEIGEGVGGKWCIEVTYRQKFPGQRWEAVTSHFNIQRVNGEIRLRQGRSLCPRLD